jgi:hypothetical protein
MKTSIPTAPTTTGNYFAHLMVFLSNYSATNPKQNGNLPSFLTTVYHPKKKKYPKNVTKQTRQILHFLKKQAEPINQYL